MIRGPARHVAICLALAVIPAIRAAASFEIEPATPGERGAATHVTLSMIDGSFHLPSCEQAGPAFPAAITLYSFRPFGLSEVEFAALWATIPIGGSPFGVGVSYQRFKALSYLEETYLVSCGIRLGSIMFQPAVRIGTVRYDGQWVDGAALVDMVLRARIMPGLRLSAGFVNPFGGALMKTGGACPTSLTIGVGYRLTHRLAWGSEIKKIAGHGTCVATGIEGRVGRRILLRSGVRTEPQELSLGLGLCIGALIVDMATTLNMDLGLTHHVGATFVWG